MRDLKKKVEKFGGVPWLIQAFGEGSAMAEIVHLIDKIEPIPLETLQRGKREHPGVQSHFIYDGVAGWGRLNEMEKWAALSGLVNDARELTVSA